MIKTKSIYSVYSKIDDEFLGDTAQKIDLPAPQYPEDIKFLYAGSE